MKLYGHPFEVLSLVASSDGALLASSCKARDKSAAQILIWTVEATGPEGGKGRRLAARLDAHDSSVVCLKFSPDNR